MRILKTLSILAISGVLFASCGEQKKEKEMDQEAAPETSEAMAMEEQAEPNIVEVASGNDNFSTLVAAVKAAELVETLSGEGPYTVFAPTNDAFGALPDGTVDNLLKPENKETLTGILTYHVVSGNYDAAAVVEAINGNNGSFAVTTVQGNDITLSLDGENVVLTDAKGGTATVVTPDVPASNGIIHAIDAVVMPE
ncbi:MAG: fasciclin domain-containing protein [Pricia sp.]